MAFIEDHSEFFDTDQGHAISSLVTTGTSSAKPVDGIFDDEFFSEGGEMGVEMSSPEFTCASGDVVGVGHGDTVILAKPGATAQTKFKVRGIQPDGTGQVKLILEEQ